MTANYVPQCFNTYGSVFEVVSFSATLKCSEILVKILILFVMCGDLLVDENEGRDKMLTSPFYSRLLPSGLGMKCHFCILSP